MDGVHNIAEPEAENIRIIVLGGKRKSRQVRRQGGCRRDTSGDEGDGGDGSEDESIGGYEGQPKRERQGGDGSGTQNERVSLTGTSAGSVVSS